MSRSLVHSILELKEIGLILLEEGIGLFAAGGLSDGHRPLSIPDHCMTPLLEGEQLYKRCLETLKILYLSPSFSLGFTPCIKKYKAFYFEDQVYFVLFFNIVRENAHNVGHSWV